MCGFTGDIMRAVYEIGRCPNASCNGAVGVMVKLMVGGEVVDK